MASTSALYCGGASQQRHDEVLSKELGSGSSACMLMDERPSDHTQIP
jgi:hypothetical protein